MPPREMTATSVVPPPMSTTMLPAGPRPELTPIAAGHRLVEVSTAAGARRLGRLTDGSFLHLRDAARHAEHDARGGHAPAERLLG